MIHVPASEVATVVNAAVAERAATGKARRNACPRTTLARWEPAPGRDPIRTIEDQAPPRVGALLPIRYTRMSASPFAFYRGSAAIMAEDLGSTPTTRIITQLCGDAHLANFGLFASPERSVVFDLNDFDETAPGPFEWDVARLTASFLLASQENGFTAGQAESITRQVASAYRKAMVSYSRMTDLDIWYSRVDAPLLVQISKARMGSRAKSTVTEGVQAASRRDRWSAVRKLTAQTPDGRRFISDPPLLVPLSADSAWQQLVDEPMTKYRQSLTSERQVLLSRYRVIDLAHKVVGVGSVGLRAFVILMQGRDSNDLLVLQAKEAVASVLEPFTGLPAASQHHGERVVQGQRLMQAVSDIFLGTTTGPRGRDYYLRQLRDMKWSPDVATMSPAGLRSLAATCGATLARSHARSGDPVQIAAYLGSGTVFDESLLAFAHRYANQVNRDFEAFRAALATGRLVAAADESAAAVASLSSPSPSVSLGDLDAAIRSATSSSMRTQN